MGLEVIKKAGNMGSFCRNLRGTEQGGCQGHILPPVLCDLGISVPNLDTALLWSFPRG